MMGKMKFLILLLITALSVVKGKGTTESTHALLKRLGFDPVQRTGINHHSKRVAQETNKARFQNDYYNSNTDSKMFVVKLPPHSPYYSHMLPEIFKSEALAKPPMSFRTNGKPAQVYHWNIPILKKMTSAKKNSVRKANEDSKVYHIKILPNQMSVKHLRQDPQKSNKIRKHKYEPKADMVKTNKVQRNKFYRFNDSPHNENSNGGHKLSNSKIQNITVGLFEKHDNHLSKTKNHLNKKLNDKYVNEVSKIKTKNHTPNYYVPAIPKQNSFYKYFSGNGKPKSFYVIEKSKKPTKLHRLL